MFPRKPCQIEVSKKNRTRIEKSKAKVLTRTRFLATVGNDREARRVRASVLRCSGAGG